jgi:FSR family fosmidomycin resistance protein-like MFS transporter
LKTSEVTVYLLVYGFTHALADAACIYLIMGGIDVRSELLTYLLLYNILAFGLQLPLGWLLDYIHKPVISAFLGCLILSASLFLFIHPLIATILAGIGNALFHVGGGTISLNLRPGKATIPGIFVAPGGIGLFVGGLLVNFRGYHPEIFVILLLFMALVIFLLKQPQIIFKNKSIKSENYAVLAIVLLLLAICIRSAVSLSLDFPWKSKMILMILYVFGIALGKGLGGFLADYFGWIKIAVGGLAISALLLFFGSQFYVAGITGIILFNFTMPVTLVCISGLLPGRPGFSFGLTTFALLGGALPTFTRYKNYLSGDPVVLILIILASIFLFSGLKLYYKSRS